MAAGKQRKSTSKSKRKGTVGVIGLGIMGGAFARNLVDAGWHVIGFDIDAGRRRALARHGVEIAKDAPDVAGRAKAVITSLPSPYALADTVQAIVGAKIGPRVIVEASTFALADKQKAERALAKAGHTMLDCPVSGTGSQAAVKDLVIYASGDSKAIARLRPMFAAFARGFHDLGAFGNGSRMKYVANLLVAINNVATAEAMVLGMKAGLEPQMIFDMVTTGAGNSRVFELRAPMMVRNDYDAATMKNLVWQKDISVIGEFAAGLGCPTPLFSATLPVYAAAMATGHGQRDTAAVCAVLESMAGLARATGAKASKPKPRSTAKKSTSKKRR
jgi:3-hydroxyisobutyrate dehydrogenase-like beta-hydroxyacid dehydrogenase